MLSVRRNMSDNTPNKRINALPMRTTSAGPPTGEVLVLINVSGSIHGDCDVATFCQLRSCHVALNASTLYTDLNVVSSVVSWVGQQQLLMSGGTVSVTASSVLGSVLATGEAAFMPNSPGFPPLGNPTFLPLSASLLSSGNTVRVGAIRGNYVAQTHLLFYGQASSR